MAIKNIYIVCMSLIFIACSCGKTTQNKHATAEPYRKVSPDFDADSAYTYVDKQVAFGCRVPGTKEHAACGDYLAAEMKRFGAEVREQKMALTAYDGTRLNARNIIASYGTDKKARVLLFAHWDTRPYSDQDPDPANRKKPLPGANDGASGVGVLMEIARILHTQPADAGIDIIFFDAEDYGMPDFAEKSLIKGNTWCLGSQYWSGNPHAANYKARFGILLDMVGAEGATFYKEGISGTYAADVVEKVWRTAGQLSYGKFFIGKNGGSITDDHVPVNEIRRIPSIDIIDYRQDMEHGFFHSWHTRKDDMRNISKETLKDVGQTVLEVIYKEK